MLSTAVLAMLLAAQTSLSCTDKVALPLPGDMAAMPGMGMTGMEGAQGHAMMICPVVLALIATSALLIAGAALSAWTNPHRALLQRSILSVLARLPALPTAGAVALAGAAAVAAMIWLERSGPPALPVCVMLVMLLAGCALVATVSCIAFGRIAIALGRRLILAVAAAIARSSNAPAAQRGTFVAPLASLYGASLLAAGRGLRAPPPFVR
jgi:hypothetical protein